MSANVRINERGWGKVLMAPPADVFDQTARLQQVEFVLTQLAPVCRPLVVQALYLLRDEFGLAAPEIPDPTALIAWADRVPAHVRARPTIAGQPPTMTGVDLSSAGLCEWLRTTVPKASDSNTGDWESLVTLASEVRAFVDEPVLRFAEFGRQVPADPSRSELWFAGPAGDVYFERVMPMAIEFFNQPDVLRVGISRHWVFVEPRGRPREATLEFAFAELEAAGFVDARTAALH